jgi:magnesium transporter
MSDVVEDLNRAKNTAQAELFDQAIEQVSASELGLLLESLPINERLARWQQVPDDEQITALVAMRTESREAILRSLDEIQLKSLLGAMDAESLIELSQNLSDTLVDFALQAMEQKHRARFEQNTQYSEEQIGRFVDHRFISFPPNAKCSQAIRAIRRSKHPFTESIYVVGKHGQWCGEILFTSLLSAEPDQRLDQVQGSSELTITPETSLIDAVERLEHADRSAVAVVTADRQLLGRVTSRLAMEIVRDTYEAKLMARVGLDENADLFLPVIQSAKRRALWLGINLLTALLAAWTIGLFEETLSQVVALAVLMPIVASMGGIAGSQTLTLIIRGLATAQITLGNAMALCRKEIGVALLNGILWALVIGSVAGVWFGSMGIAGVMAVAIMVNILAAALAGVAIPLVLDKLKIDPALSGAVVLTTVTDVVGFATFLGGGTLFLLSK